MTDEEFYEHLKDRFFGYELVELLNISIEDVLYVFRGEIEDNRQELEEYLIDGD